MLQLQEITLGPLMSAQNRKVRIQIVGSKFGVNNVTAWVHSGSTVQAAAISVMVVGYFLSTLITLVLSTAASLSIVAEHLHPQ